MRCTSPVTVKKPDGFLVLAPCGHCQSCLAYRSSSWVLRMLLESGSHEHSSFGTFTYDEAHRPGILIYEHIQGFLKRLRKSSPTPIRFFCCGEHGKRTDREHWHMILFGFRAPYLGVSHIKQWPYGGAHFGELNTARLKYTAKYTLKNVESVYKMSTRPGLGLPACTRLGQWMGSQYDTMPMVKSLRIDGVLYPLDRSARAALDAGYALGGGSFIKKGDRLEKDIQARLYRYLPLDIRGRADNAELVLRTAAEVRENAYGKI